MHLHHQVAGNCNVLWFFLPPTRFLVHTRILSTEQGVGDLPGSTMQSVWAVTLEEDTNRDPRHARELTGDRIRPTIIETPGLQTLSLPLLKPDTCGCCKPEPLGTEFSCFVPACGPDTQLAR
jgi:hypothetical protein